MHTMTHIVTVQCFRTVFAIFLLNFPSNPNMSLLFFSMIFGNLYVYLDWRGKDEITGKICSGLVWFVLHMSVVCMNNLWLT